MSKRYSKKESRGLPGGPHEQFTYVTGVFSQDMYSFPQAQEAGEGYRKDAPGYNDPYKVIPSGNITMTEQDGGALQKGPLLGIDNMGNQQMMFPGYEYQFPGDMVMEIPVAQKGIEGPRTYNDSASLYNAMIMQDRLMGDNGRGVFSNVDWTKKALKKGRKENPIIKSDGSILTDFSTGLPVYSTKDFVSKYDQFGPNLNRFNQISARPKDLELINYYESLGFTEDDIMFHSSPDIVSDKIKPVGTYYDGTAYSPIYPKPKYPYSVKGEKPIELLENTKTYLGASAKKKPQPSYRIHDYMKMEGMDPSPESRDMWAKMLGIPDYKRTAEQNEELIKRLKEYKKNPIRAQKGGATDEFNSILKKYTTKGWNSLTEQEKNFYSEMYSGNLPQVTVQADRPNPVIDAMREGRNKLSNEISTSLLEGTKEATGYNAIKDIYERPGYYTDEMRKALNDIVFLNKVPTANYSDLMNLVELSPGVGVLGKGAKKAGKALTKGPLKNVDNYKGGLGAFPGEHTPTFYKQNLKTMTKSEKYNRNISDLNYAQQWAKKYDYDFPKNLKDISKSDEATDKIIKGVVDKHNTFSRGVSTNWEEIKEKLEKKEWSRTINEFKDNNIDYINDPKSAAEYMATHVPSGNTTGLRASLGNLSNDLDALYTSNSRNLPEGYTYGDGFIVDVKRPTDFSSFDRRDWIKNNELDYFEHALPNDNSDLAKRILKTEHTSFLEDIYKNKIIPSKNSLGQTNNPMAELANRQYQIIDNLNRQGKFANREELVKFKQILNEDIPKLTKFKSFINKAKTPIADLYVDGFNHKNNLKRANEALLKQQVTLDKHFPDWRNIKSKINSNSGYDISDDKYAHYIHMGKPGEKLFDAVNFERITPKSYKNTSRSHGDGFYNNKYSAGAFLPAIGTGAFLSQDTKQQGGEPYTIGDKVDYETMLQLKELGYEFE